MKKPKTIDAFLRRILAIVCTVAMILPIMPVLPATAASTKNYKIKSAQDFVTRIQEGVYNRDTYSLKLERDIELVVTKDINFDLSKGQWILDLNGKTFTIREGSDYRAKQIFQLKADSSFTILDSSDAKTGIIRFIPFIHEKGRANVSLFLVCQDSRLFLESGTIDGGGVEQSANGSCVRLTNANNYGSDYSKFIMSGGTIQNFCGWTGGAVYVGGSDIIFTMSGGSIRNCTARQYGGAVANFGKFTMSNDSSIENCVADNQRELIDEETEEPVSITVGRNNLGGGVYNAGVFNMVEGIIKNCSVPANQGKGGGIYAATGSSTVIGGAYLPSRITGNSARHGGGIFMWGGTMTVTNAVIEGNMAEQAGSQVCLFKTNKPNPVVFTMTGGQISCSALSLKNNAHSAIYVEDNTNKLTIQGTASVSVYGKQYAIRSGTGTNIVIDTSGYVYAHGNNGGFERMPTVTNMLFQGDVPTFGYFPGTTMKYIVSPTLDDYHRRVVKLSRDPIYTITFLVDGQVYHTETNLKDSNIVPPTVAYKKPGYDFVGWFDDNGQQFSSTLIKLTGNLVCTARFQEKAKYALEYVTGGSVPESRIEYMQNLQPDGYIKLPQNPTFEGHTFTRWFAGGVPIGDAGDWVPIRTILEKGGVTFDGTLRIVAMYTANPYKVTFIFGNGQPNETREVLCGDTLILPADPTRPGYTFAGWDNLPDTMPAGDITVTAKWTKNQYTITFDPANGETVTTITLPYGDAITAPADPTRPGYTFAGWDNLPDTMPAGDITVTAKWTARQFAVTVVNGSGSGDYVLGATVTIRANEAPDGMAFDRWVILSGEVSLQDVSAAETTFTMPIGQVTVQATYKHVHRYTQENTDTRFLASPATCEHRAVYYYSCSCGAKGSNTFETGTFAEHTFSQNDWCFDDKAHWHECTVCGAELHREIHSDDDKDHACDTCGKTVSVCSDDNRDHMCDTCGNRLTDHSGGTATCLERAICSLCGAHYGEFSAHAYRTTWSYDHTGHWHECSVCGEKQDESVHRYADDLDADCEDCGYVRTVTRTFTVTFDPANGEPLFTVTLSAGAAIPVPADPVRDGYFFIGWKNLPSAMPENDIIVTAQWQRIGLQNILLDPTSDLTLGIPVFLPDVHAEVMLRVTLNGKTEEFTALSAENPSGRYFFLYENVTPQNLMDEISLELLVDGVCTDTLTTTTADICLQIVDERPELKQAVTDLFAYGAALQAYTGYKPEGLASLRALMDEKGLAASNRDVEPSTSKSVTAPMTEGAELKGIGLYFTNRTGLYIRFTTEDVSSVTVTVNGALYDQKDFKARGSGEYVLYLPDVALDELDDVNEVILRAHGHKVQIIRYALSDYITVTQYGKNTYSDGVKALTKALFNWKKSAEELHTAP